MSMIEMTERNCLDRVPEMNFDEKNSKENIHEETECSVSNCEVKSERNSTTNTQINDVDAKGMILTPPPPPPPTPIHTKVRSGISPEKSECPTPPPLPKCSFVHNINMKMAPLELKTALEIAKQKICAFRNSEQIAMNKPFSKTDLSENSDSDNERENIKVADNPIGNVGNNKITNINMNATGNDLLCKVEEYNFKVLSDVNNKQQSTKNLNINSNIISSNPNQDEELLSLQLLSARSSTPYTQPICTAITNGDMEIESGHVSPLENHNIPVSKAYDEKEVKPSEIVNNPGNCESKTMDQVQCKESIIHYTKEKLLLIRTNLGKIMETRSQQTLHCPVKSINIVNCNTIELEARLRRLNIWKNVEEFCREGRMQSVLKTHNPNYMMPEFYKKQHPLPEISESLEFKDSSIIASQPRLSSESNQFKSNEKLERQSFKSLWDKKFERYNLNYQEKRYSNNNNNNNNRNDQRNEKNINSLNANYVKRVLSGFLVVSNSKDRKHEEDTYLQQKSHTEEPEWFICGPTSRLDTIELCGFEEDERNSDDLDKNATNSSTKSTKMRSETDQIARKNNTNNNDSELKTVTRTSFDSNVSHDNFDKVHWKSYHRKQSDQFTQNDDKQKHCQNGKKNDSKFIPLFENDINNRTDVSNNLEPAKSLNSKSCEEFFKRALDAQAQSDNQRNNCGFTSVNELENKMRLCSILKNQAEVNNEIIQNNGKKSQMNNQNIENVRKLFGQLANSTINSISHASHNTFNNVLPNVTSEYVHQNYGNAENLSHFIMKQTQQQLQQQLLQKQQQATLITNMQLKAIITRPESQILLFTLIRGEISKQGLLVQLANPNLSQRDRESITAVLTYTSLHHLQQQSISDSVYNHLQNIKNFATVQNIVKQQQLQQQRPPFSTMMPMSQEQLQNHTNAIMQNALIKRKIEERNSNLLNLQKIIHLNNLATNAKQQLQFQQQQQQQQQKSQSRQVRPQTVFIQNTIMSNSNAPQIGLTDVDMNSPESGRNSNIIQTSFSDINTNVHSNSALNLNNIHPLENNSMNRNQRHCF